MNITFRGSIRNDAEWLAELRAEVLLADLGRLGRYDPIRVRQRFLDAFEPDQTRIIVVDGQDSGSVAVRVDSDARWIEHFYLRPDLQGQGIGGVVLSLLLESSDPRPFKLNVLQGSPARRLYERHGFVLDSEDDVDVWMSRAAGHSEPEVHERIDA